MQKSTFQIARMDCPAEEQMVRMKLEGLAGIASIQADIPARKLEVVHDGGSEPIQRALESLRFDTTWLGTTPVEGITPAPSAESERKTLLLVLLINAFFFVLEVLAGLLTNSMGLAADGLDMLADSLVYGMALFAVGGAAARKQGIARASGYFQAILAVIGIMEVLRRFFSSDAIPTFQAMIGISLLALAGNAASLLILQRSKSDDVHMRASLIFTSNDVIINIGVILAGVLVFATGSKIPDLVVGAVVFIIVARGAARILQLTRN